MTIDDIYKRFLKCDSVNTDTRKIDKNSIFFALKGDNFNGNKFAALAINKGASYCVVDEKEYALNQHYILVDDVLETLQQLASYHRKILNIPIIALTGSNGKTTTKELIKVVLSERYNVSATVGNLNNHIGVPLTLLQMSKDTEIGIVEMGANHKKEIEFLSNIAMPDYGLITNFGKAHLEGFGNLEGVIEGKSELYDHLKTNQKTIFVNTNDAIQIKQIGSYSKTIEFGKHNSNALKIELLNSQPYVSLKFNKLSVKSKLTGAYNFNNIAVAIAIGSHFKIEDQKIASAIENYTPSNNRSQIINKGSNTIILDAYNANPTSMMAAVETFETYNKSNKSLFLGDMFELGKDTEVEHQGIATLLEQNPNKAVYLIGHNFYNTKTSKSHIRKFETFEDLKYYLKEESFINQFILIKGSRGMALERILDLL